MDPNAAAMALTPSTPANENDPDNAGSVSQQDSVDEQETEIPPSRSLKIYPRQQILALHKSPLVCLPDGMPELKDWFGTENEHNLNRKDSEPPATNGGRDRRFRRDAEDGDLPARPSFRSAASQPSQMGNFRHHSLRSGDREMDRDREGEKLRNLSDKFDRDRLSISLRKDREPAPHFAAGASKTSTQTSNIATRRAEAREGNKKKVGESSEDWRRGTDSRRSEKLDRDDRDSRRDSSTSRQERKDRDRDRDDFRRERDERRDREDPDDLKRWRDDGKKDERLSARRERGRDKPPHESSWENGDRRWALSSDDKDKAKKVASRDKKTNDDSKERDDRRFEREKEKEPAWMDEYIPASPGGGILGAKGNDGELDGIQAWKKNMKEKEQKSHKPSKLSPTSQEPPRSLDHSESAEDSLDEIQRFKKMMELAQKRKTPTSESVTSPVDSIVGRTIQDNGAVQKTESIRPMDPTQSLLSLLTSQAAPAAPPSTSPGVKLHSSMKPSPITSEPSADNTESASLPIRAPQGSRLLSLGSRVPAKPQPNHPIPNGSPLSSNPQKANMLVSPTEGQQGPSRNSNGFSPFEEQREQSEAQRRVVDDRGLLSGDAGSWDPSGGDLSGLGNVGGRGSRFAKFFDAKGKEAPPQHLQAMPKSQGPVGYVSSSPTPGQRSDFSNVHPPPNADHRTVEELFAKLNTQPSRNNPTLTNPSSATSFGLHSNLQQQHLHHQLQPHHPQPPTSQSQHLHHPGNARMEFIETRNFTPDGLVPGLRSVPPPRGRENGPMYQDHEELLNAQRLNLQQRTLVEQLYPGSLTSGYAQQGNRNIGLTLQQQQFRGGPSPTLQGQANHVQQRLPPGLVNLGGRPPHDPSQMLGLQGNIGSQLHHQHNFNNFHPHGSNVGYGGPQHQLRAPPPSNAHSLSAHQLGALGGPGSLDLRNTSQQQQAQLLAMSGLSGNPLRGVSNSAYNQLTPAQMQLAQMRQQQQPPQLPPHMLPHMIPHHHQQQQVPMSSNQSTQDLMALLMGGSHRE